MTMPDRISVRPPNTEHTIGGSWWPYAKHTHDLLTPGAVRLYEFIRRDGDLFKTLLAVEFRKGYQQGLLDMEQTAAEVIDDHNREEHGDES